MQHLLSAAVSSGTAPLLPKPEFLRVILNFEHLFPSSKGALSRHIHPTQALVMHTGSGRIPAEIKGNKRFASDARVLVGRGPKQRKHFGFAHPLTDVGQWAISGDGLVNLPGGDRRRGLLRCTS